MKPSLRPDELLHCWYDFENGHTCMLLDGHAGLHEPTSDDKILVMLNDDGAGVTIKLVGGGT